MANDGEGALGVQIANPKALGFGVLGISLWMYAMVFAGWFPNPETLGTNIASNAAVMQTYALLVAALACFLRGETWHAVFFMFWSVEAWAVTVQGGEAASGGYSGWFYMTFAVFLLILTWGAVQDQKVGSDRALLSFGLSVYALGVSLATWGLGVLGVIGGYIGLLTALFAFWITAKEIGGTVELA